MKQLFLKILDDTDGGFEYLSASGEWEAWLRTQLPEGLHKTVRDRLVSNLKHIIAGLEMKAALIVPHHTMSARRLLFEPYFQTLIFEFCVGVFSVCEALGSSQWLTQNGYSGAEGKKVKSAAWSPLLKAVYDEAGTDNLATCLSETIAVRDRIHQDNLGARSGIDWHAFTYKSAFEPASAIVRCLLKRNADLVPEATNLAQAYPS